MMIRTRTYVLRWEFRVEAMQPAKMFPCSFVSIRLIRKEL